MHAALYGGWGSSKRLDQKMARDPIETHKSMTCMTLFYSRL